MHDTNAINDLFRCFYKNAALRIKKNAELAIAEQKMTVDLQLQSIV